MIMKDEGRVFVRVNGVARFPGSGDDEIVLSPNTVSFNSEVSAQSTIDISVYTEKDTIEKTITFNANRTFIVNTNSGAWGNVRYVEEFGSDGQLKPNKWWLYSCTSHGALAPSSRLRIEEILEADGITTAIPDTEFNRLRFLIASQPLENADRYLNFYVSVEDLHSNFALLTGNSSSTDILADSHSLRETYPPLQLKYDAVLSQSSFVTSDVFTSDSTIQIDTSQTRLAGKKIIGPI
jgi:hypothetical protein